MIRLYHNVRPLSINNIFAKKAKSSSGKFLSKNGTYQSNNLYTAFVFGSFYVLSPLSSAGAKADKNGKKAVNTVKNEVAADS